MNIERLQALEMHRRQEELIKTIHDAQSVEEREEGLRRFTAEVASRHANATQKIGRVCLVLFGEGKAGNGEVVLSKVGEDNQLVVIRLVPSYPVQLTFFGENLATGRWPLGREGSPETLPWAYRDDINRQPVLTIRHGQPEWRQDELSTIDQKEAILRNARDRIVAFHESSLMILGALSDPVLNPEFVERAAVLQQA
jgi:hypothetical protein